MRIKSIRHWFTTKSTTSVIKVNETYFGFCLEDVARPDGVKIPGETCIQPGTYNVTITESERFKRLMPLLNDVPMFKGVRVHWGNSDKDTEGCPIVGYERLPDRVYMSVKAFTDLFYLIQKALDAGEEVTWEITNEPL